MLSEYNHMILNLLGVLILMLIVLYLLKRFKVAKDAKNQHIKIINTVAIGAKERLILMEVNNTILLVGATPSHIETLYVFDELEPESAAIDAPPHHTFAEEMTAVR